MGQKMGAPRRYEEGYTQYHFSGPKRLYDEFLRVVAREDKRASTKIQEFMTEYIKVHSSGNPSFELDRWVDNEDFKAVPAFFESKDKWNKYMKDCELKELENIQAKARGILDMSENEWHDMKFPKPKPKSFIEQIQDIGIGK